mgnify:CR=1 FL=1
MADFFGPGAPAAVMVVAINQPCYLPWRGFFALMKAADVHALSDQDLVQALKAYGAQIEWVNPSSHSREISAEPKAGDTAGNETYHLVAWVNQLPANASVAGLSAFVRVSPLAAGSVLITASCNRDRIYDVPGATIEQYEEIAGKISMDKPKGAHAHIAGKNDRGLQVIEVWDSQEDLDRYMNAGLGEAMQAANAAAMAATVATVWAAPKPSSRAKWCTSRASPVSTMISRSP